ncbi:MAG: TolC family protein [Armatimonadota bacterium]
MIRIMKLVLSAALSVIFISALWAQDASPIKLTLDECITLAMKNQIDVNTGQNNVTVSKGRLTQAQSSYFPQVTVQNNTFQESSRDLPLQKTTGTGISATMNVYDGGLREANVKGAKYGLKQTEASLTRIRQTVKFNVTTAYYTALQSKHLASVAEENVKYNEALRAQIQAQADAGDAARVDILPVEAQLANTQVDMLSAQNTVQTSLIQLQNTIGLSPKEGFDIVESQLPAEMAIPVMTDYVDDALSNRPDILQAKANLGVSKASVSSTKVLLYPRPVISGSYQKNLDGNITQDDTQINGSIVFDLFDGGSNRAAYKEARAQEDTSKQQLLQVDKDIRAQVADAYYNLVSTKQRMAASEVGLNASQRNYEAQKERYNLKLASTLDLLNAEVQLITAQSNTIRSRYQYFIALAQMDYAVGLDGGSNAK